MKTEFLKPRFTGPRFVEHTIPVEVARDLAAYEELVVELAKHLYLQDHPDRQRVPRGFEKSFNLHLEQIEEGSARTVLSWVATGTLALQLNGDSYFDKARDLVADCVVASANKQALPQNFPKHLLDYFNVFGRSLRDGEAVELPLPRAAEAFAVLTPDRRKALVLAAKKVYTKEVELEGAVAETDWERQSFRLRLASGRAVVAPLPDSFDEIIRQIGGKERMQARVKGIGVFDAWDQLEKLSETQHVEIMPNQALASEIESLLTLSDGWLEGLGKAIDRESLSWVEDRLLATFPEDLPFPHTAPSPEGGLFLEWIAKPWRISAEFLLPTHRCELQATDTSTGDSHEADLDLVNDHGWLSLYDFVRRFV